MQPYEFGYAVGATLEKQAFGPQLGGLNPFHQDNTWGGFNPLNQQNTTARTMGYFAPGLSSIQAGQDLVHNISQGNVLGSLGSAGMMALGLIPGAGLVTGAAKGLLRGGRALAGGGRMAQTVGKGLTAAADGAQALSRGMVAANRGATQLNTAMSQGIQKHIPLMQTNWKQLGSVGPVNFSLPMNPMKSLGNAMIRNPINTVAMTTSSAPPQNTAAQIAAQKL
jgi:hypothetical protein